YSQSGAPVQVKESWAIQKPYDQGSKVVVAVVDTGLDMQHGLFADSGAIWTNQAELNGQAGIDDDNNGYIDDVHGWNFAANTSNNNDDNDHGTHCAGIILGVGQDVLATPVRESKVKIMPLKFLDSTGAGSTASAVSAIIYAVKNGAKVISNSWGGSSYSQSLHEAYTYAYSNGVVIASAAGNSNSDNDSVDMYPANLDTPNNIAVAATDDSDNRASFSNFGATKVSVAAPGVRILSSVPGNGCIAPGCYMMMSGTSMATPFVAGMAALIFREAPQLSAYQVKSLIVGSVDPIAGLNGKVSSGGRVNVYKAIQSAIASSSTAAWAPSYSPDYKASRSPASDSTNAAAPAGCGLVKAFVDEGGGSGGGAAGNVADIFLVLTVLFLPLIVAVNLRSKVSVAKVANRRVFERFNLAKQASLQLSDQIVNITTADISMGGLSFSSDAGFEKGQIIELKFEDGSQTIQAEVVRSHNNTYGLKFLDASEEFKFEIKTWTSGLVPTN
ncbi:MAG: S8 family serine peptidase, partial [Pseudobdellovibrio sp.]